MTEWRDVPGYGDRYQVSACGRIRRRGFTDCRGAWHPPKELSVSKKTVYAAIFVRVNGKDEGIYLHRALALAFVPNPLQLPHVNHIDGNKRNNAVDNLEWTTRAGNMRHARQTGLRRQKLTEEDVRYIRSNGTMRSGRGNGNITALAIRLRITPEQVRNVLTGRHWSWLK